MKGNATGKGHATGHLPPLVVRLAGVWILVGAVFKLFWGTPADLPLPVRDLGSAIGLELGITYNLAIGIELALATLALLRPRLGWAPVVALFLAFDAILSILIARGAESCGCFGSKIPVPPEAMLALDSAFLLAILLVRPWSSLRDRKPGPVLLTLSLGLALALPWFFDREATGRATSEDGTFTQWLELDPETWIGMDIWETPLGKNPLSQFIDVQSLPLDGLWVFWRWTCDHCKEHLEALAANDTGERLITLIRLKEPQDSPENGVIGAWPSGGHVVHAELPDTYEYVITTPGELLLEGGRVIRALEGVSPEKNVFSLEPGG